MGKISKKIWNRRKESTSCWFRKFEWVFEWAFPMESNDFDELYYICPFRTKWLFESNEIESSRMKRRVRQKVWKKEKLKWVYPEKLLLLLNFFDDVIFSAIISRNFVRKLVNSADFLFFISFHFETGLKEKCDSFRLASIKCKTV